MRLQHDAYTPATTERIVPVSLNSEYFWPPARFNSGRCRSSAASRISIRRMSAPGSDLARSHRLRWDLLAPEAGLSPSAYWVDCEAPEFCIPPTRIRKNPAVAGGVFVFRIAEQTVFVGGATEQRHCRSQVQTTLDPSAASTRSYGRKLVTACRGEAAYRGG